MTAHHYIVAHNDSHWKVSFHGTEQGPFVSKEEAIAVAIESARKSRTEGLEVEVLVQDIESNFRLAWKSNDGDGLEKELSSSA